MNELYFLKKYLEEELMIAINQSRELDKIIVSTNRIKEIQNAMQIIGEYEHHIVNTIRK